MPRITYSVPMVRQFQNPICWVACAAMIISYSEFRTATVRELLGYDPSNSSIPNPATTWQIMYSMLNSWSIDSVGPQMCPATQYIVDTLRNKGPFILTHYTRTLAPSHSSPGTHAVVITGIDTTKNECYYNNPWGTMNNKVAINTVLSSMERLWNMNLKSVAYYKR